MTGTETAPAVKADPGAMFTEGFVDAAGFHVRYLSAGDGPAVLYLPGAGGPVMTYALDELAERYRVIVVEYPGWGAQPNDVADFDGLAAQVADIATALGLDRFHLMGTSFGGACALHFAAAHPERVESLVLEAPAKFREASVHPSTLSPEEFVTAFRSHPERVPHMSPPDPAFMERVWPTVERLMGDGADDGLLARLADLPTRTLIVFGRDDGIINPINGRTLRRTLRNSSLQYVFDAAHDVQSDRPEAFVDVVGEFLDRGMRFLINYDDGLINP
jgi:pimeloyl-ACP methyl ester carboxylesterase